MGDEAKVKIDGDIEGLRDAVKGATNELQAFQQNVGGQLNSVLKDTHEIANSTGGSIERLGEHLKQHFMRHLYHEAIHLIFEEISKVAEGFEAGYTRSGNFFQGLSEGIEHAMNIRTLTEALKEMHAVLEKDSESVNKLNNDIRNLYQHQGRHGDVEIGGSTYALDQQYPNMSDEGRNEIRRLREQMRRRVQGEKPGEDGDLQKAIKQLQDDRRYEQDRDDDPVMQKAFRNFFLPADAYNAFQRNAAKDRLPADQHLVDELKNSQANDQKTIDQLIKNDVGDRGPDTIQDIDSVWKRITEAAMSDYGASGTVDPVEAQNKNTDAVMALTRVLEERDGNQGINIFGVRLA